MAKAKGRVVTTFINVQIIDLPHPKFAEDLVPTFARLVGKPQSRWSGKAFRIDSDEDEDDHGIWTPMTTAKANSVNWENSRLAKAFIVEVCGGQRIPIAMVLVGPIPARLYRKTFYQHRWAYVLAAMGKGSWSLTKVFGRWRDEHNPCPDQLRWRDFKDLVEKAIKDDDARELFGCKGGEIWDVFLKWLHLNQDVRYYDQPHYEN